MPTVTIRELKQNPRAVVERALATGLPYRITSHGRDTGAVVQADAAGPRRVVPGAALNALPPVSDAVGQAWKDDIAAARLDHGPVDPWAAQ
ncbi:MAG: type II toxin-antitoxin system Phd/YefM family antitoxin [Propionibacteriaceae bacterium]|nr:type II toxin-antitoxin system Phd/YefM family antitoxin [Propionibacteriaceae bacterium]